jgi:hypothetical protein
MTKLWRDILPVHPAADTNKRALYSPVASRRAGLDAVLARFSQELSSARTRDGARAVLAEYTWFFSGLSERSRERALSAAEAFIANLPDDNGIRPQDE